MVENASSFGITHLLLDNYLLFVSERGLPHADAAPQAGDLGSALDQAVASAQECEIST